MIKLNTTAFDTFCSENACTISLEKHNAERAKRDMEAHVEYMRFWRGE